MTYALRKSRHILHTSYALYRKKGKTLPTDLLSHFERDLQDLDQAVLRKDREEADRLAHQVEIFTKTHFKRAFGSVVGELLIAIIFALIIAIIIRQMLVEFYEIPTGSMRPTFKEKDHLAVSKTTFGIDYPLLTKHLYFDPNLVQRSSIAIFSGENINIPNNDTTYFWLIPYKKRYIKRCMAKPGDTIYFYGGKIYGMDSNGEELTELLDSPWLNKLEYIPFNAFEGRRVTGSYGSNGLLNQIYFHLMDLPIGRLVFQPSGNFIGEINNGKNWVTDQPKAELKTHSELETYSDFWGMRNFAMARLLTKDQVKALTDIDVRSLEEAPLYLELRHNPSLTYPKPRILYDNFNNLNILLTPYVTVIPMEEKHLNALMENMYTARFLIRDGYAIRYSTGPINISSSSPRFPGIPDGTYEFYYGKAYQIKWGGIAFELPKDHPIYRKDPHSIQNWYNLGIEFLTYFEPASLNQSTFPSRYAYFREGSLYLLGAPIFSKEDATLKNFVALEELREKQASANKPYVAFKDHGPPLKEGRLDKEFLTHFGLKIPDHHYLLLGDNHAMSQDSRYFGFVPEANLQGSPSVLLWPPGSRWGIPPQKPYPWVTLPHVVMWGLVIVILGTMYGVHRYRLTQPVFKKIS